MPATLQATLTQYIKAVHGIRFAYRRFGNPSVLTKVRLILHIQFRAKMDFWEPLCINTLPAKCEVMSFDNAGVGHSSGTVPDTYQGWANDLIAFVRGIGIHNLIC